MERKVHLRKIYRHFKGGLYEVIAVALHTENGEDLVIYTSLSSGQTFARPLEMFLGEVPEGKENPTGQKYRLMSLDELPPVISMKEMEEIIYQIENLVGNK